MKFIAKLQDFLPNVYQDFNCKTSKYRKCTNPEIINMKCVSEPRNLVCFNLNDSDYSRQFMTETVS